MKKIISYINQNRYFLLFILVFAYVESIYTRIIVRQTLNIYIFTPEAAFASLLNAVILFFILHYFIKKWQKFDVLSNKELIKIFSISILVYTVIMYSTGFIISLLFNTVERNFNQQVLLISLLSNIINGFIYGSFFLAYYYYHQNKQQQEDLIKYNQSIAESKINHLKNQLNPHFLFNNLNILDQLIEEDKHAASDFLNEFAEIYRYVLQGSDKKIISVHEEVEFAKQYFKLIQHKYGSSYQLKIENISDQNTAIVPLTLQLLIENVIKHNVGSLNAPIYITVDINKCIIVSNNKNLKENPKKTSGRALKNLEEQYKILTKENMVIDDHNHSFTVTIPLILK